MTFPGSNTGSFGWENGSNNELATGLHLSVIRGKDTTLYTPVSGVVTISTYKKDSDDFPTEVVGSFCGTVRSPEGNTISITNGRLFYEE